MENESGNYHLLI